MIKKIVLYSCIIIFIVSFLNAANGRIKLKNRLIPIYVTDIRFLYYGDITPIPVVVFSFKEQKFKYIKYPFTQIRKIEFSKFVGERNFAPVYYIKVWLQKGGHFLHGYMIPITKIVGFRYRRKWEFPLEYESSYEENIFNIKEIEFEHKIGE